MLDHETISALGRLGLSEKEVAVYVALTTLGEATAYKIAEVSNVKKPTVYVILEDLRRKGLVLKIPHAKKQLFVANDLEEYVRDRERDVKQALCALPALRATSSPHSRVLFFSGVRGITEAMDYKFASMQDKSLASFYGNMAGSEQILSDIYEPWHEKAAAADVSFRIIVPTNSAHKHFQPLQRLAKEKPGIELRQVPFDVPPDTSIEIGDDFIRIITARDMHATIIDNMNVATTMRYIFDSVWATSSRLSTTNPNGASSSRVPRSHK